MTVRRITNYKGLIDKTLYPKAHAFKPFQVAMIVQNTSFLQCLSVLPGKETDAGTLSGKRHDKGKAWEPLPEAIHMYLFPIISKHYPANG